MATDSTRPITRTVIHASLFDALAEHRHPEHARRMAGHLLREERDGRQLVGLREDCLEAVYYCPAGFTLTARPFDKHGVRTSDAETLWRHLGDAASWVDAHVDDLDWVHPHFRWVLDLDDDTAVWCYER